MNQSFPKIVKIALRAVLLLLVCILIGTGCILAVYKLPTEGMLVNVKKSLPALEKEGCYYTLFDGLSSRLDNYTDALMLTEVISTNHKGAIQDAMNNYKVPESIPDKIEALRFYIENPDCPIDEYSRYWHGYLVILKPLFLFCTYSQIRLLNILLQISLIAALCVVLVKRKMTALIVPVIAVWYLCCPPAVMMAFQYSTVFYLSFGGCLMLLIFQERIWKMGYFYFFLLIGALTSYFDFLTYPMLTVVLPLTFALVMTQQKGMSGVQPFKMMTASGLSWGVGYLGMWAGKWAAASLLLRRNCFTVALETLQFRTGTDLISGRTAGLESCIEVLLESPSWQIIVLAMILCILIVVIKRENIHTGIETVYPYLLLVLVPVVWSIITANHNSIHCWFTYRNLTGCVFSILTGILAQVIRGDLILPFFGGNRQEAVIPSREPCR